MNALSKNRADNLLQYNWLCDSNLANWIINILNVYGTSILDVGCGNGYMLDFYHENFEKIAAIEPCDALIDKIKENIAKKDIIFEQADAEHIPFENDSFEIVFAKSSLHHFYNIQQGLSEMKRISKRIVAIMEVIAPSEECIPFLQNILIKKEDGREKTSIYTMSSLKNTISNGIEVNTINQLLYDQYIDIEKWIQFSDLSSTEKNSLLNYILSMDSLTAKQMHLHKRNNRYMMLRRMCLSIAFVK